MEVERQPSPGSSPEASSLGDAIPVSPAAESALVPAGTSNDAAAPVPDSPPNDALWERPFLLSALTLGVFWAIESTDYEHTQWWTAGLLLTAVLIGAALLRGVRFAPWLVLAHAVAVGFADRVVRSPVGGSDVILVTKEAIGVVARGENPYTHYYETTIPPGSPFAYLPGELLFHAIPNAIFGGIDRVNQWSGIGVVVLLAALAPLVGPGRAALATALYGTFGLAAYRAMDGSNDTGLGFLLVLATVLLAWSERPSRVSRWFFYGSAIIFGWALGYKQFAALIYPFVLLYLRRRGGAWRGHGAIAIGLPVVATLPFLLVSPTALLSATTAGLTWHTNVWGLNLWAGLQPLAPGLVDAVSPALNVLTPLALLGIALAFALRPAASLSISLLQGLALLFAALFLARWTTSPYYTGAGALLAAAIALTPPDSWTSSVRSTTTATPPDLHLARHLVAPSVEQAVLSHSNPDPVSGISTVEALVLRPKESRER
jgi:hypothetical protein